MKILHVISSVWKRGGGTSEVVPRLCEALVKRGEHVTLASLLLSQEMSNTYCSAVNAGMRSELFVQSKLLHPLALSKDLRFGLKHLVAESDIVHIHGLWQAPVWYAAAECRKQDKPYVMMPHGFLEPERLKVSKWKKRIVGALIERKNLKNANALVATAESEARGFKQYGLNKPVHIMPIGLDLEPFLPPKPHEQKILLYFSRFTPIKGLDMLAEVWSKIDRKDWKLLLVGPSDRGYADEIKKLYGEKCEAGSYEFRGPVFGQEKYELLSSVGAMVLPTRSENWSIAVAEGMAAGLPVVCTKGAPWECLNTAKAGYWVEISKAGIDEGLNKLFALTDEERRGMGANGRKWIEENLNWDKISNEMVRFYEKVIAEHGR